MVSILGDGFNTGIIVYVTQRDQVKEVDNIFSSNTTTNFCRIPPHNIGFARVTVATKDGSRAILEDALIYTKSVKFEDSLKPDSSIFNQHARISHADKYVQARWFFRCSKG